MSLTILGCMTGTSCDALDVACVRFESSTKFQTLWRATAPYPDALRSKVLWVQKAGVKLTLRETASLNRDLGIWYGKTLQALIKKAGNKKSLRPDLIANHGQTVAHFPKTKGSGSTVQLGDPTSIAQITGLTTLGDFRSGDMAASGQGAPLVPAYHRALIRKIAGQATGVAIHNLGGISNLTYFKPDGGVLAFDTGPGNFWIDLAVHRSTHGRLHFDRGGRLASQGSPDLDAIRALLRNRYFKKPPPKSTGRDDFPFSWLLQATSARGNDLVATATAFSVETIATAYEQFILNKKLPLRSIHFCGGGAQNSTLMRLLKARLPKISVQALNNQELDPQFIEAEAFAYLGYLSLQGRPLGGTWTGTRGFAPPAHIIPGANWASILRRLSQIS